MSHLRALPRIDEAEPARAVTVVSPETRDVVYVEESASIEIITEALKAWGLRVRQEREARQPDLPAVAQPADSNWQTTRPEHPGPGRLANVLSPLWLPIRKPDTGNEPVAAWSWFSRAA